MNRGQLPTNQLHDINWSALDHASRAVQHPINVIVTLCGYLCACMHAHMRICMQGAPSELVRFIRSKLDHIFQYNNYYG